MRDEVGSIGRALWAAAGDSARCCQLAGAFKCKTVAPPRHTAGRADGVSGRVATAVAGLPSVRGWTMMSDGFCSHRRRVHRGLHTVLH